MESQFLIKLSLHRLVPKESPKPQEQAAQHR
jgi:hypothetical protein